MAFHVVSNSIVMHLSCNLVFIEKGVKCAAWYKNRWFLDGEKIVILYLLKMARAVAAAGACSWRIFPAFLVAVVVALQASNPCLGPPEQPVAKVACGEGGVGVALVLVRHSVGRRG